jgi:hypothetical protein
MPINIKKYIHTYIHAYIRSTYILTHVRAYVRRYIDTDRLTNKEACMQLAILIVFRKNANDTTKSKLMILKLYIVTVGCISGERESK